jgi:hypothetical protein
MQVSQEKDWCKASLGTWLLFKEDVEDRIAANFSLNSVNLCMPEAFLLAQCCAGQVLERAVQRAENFFSCICN